MTRLLGGILVFACIFASPASPSKPLVGAQAPFWCIVRPGIIRPDGRRLLWVHVGGLMGPAATLRAAARFDCKGTESHQWGGELQPVVEGEYIPIPTTCQDSIAAVIDVVIETGTRQFEGRFIQPIRLAAKNTIAEQGRWLRQEVIENGIRYRLGGLVPVPIAVADIDASPLMRPRHDNSRVQNVTPVIVDDPSLKRSTQVQVVLLIDAEGVVSGIKELLGPVTPRIRVAIESESKFWRFTPGMQGGIATPDWVKVVVDVWPKGEARPHLPAEAAAVPLSGRDKLYDLDHNGLADALELRMRLPTKRNEPAYASVEVFGQERGTLRSITFASLTGSDVWRFSEAVVYVPVCSTCAGGDSLVVKVDGEKLRQRGLGGPYVAMVELWEGVERQPGAELIGRYELVTAKYLSSQFGWLPARTVKTGVPIERDGTTRLLVTVLVERSVELELHGDIYEGANMHSAALARIPKTVGLHDVNLAFQRVRPDSGRVATPAARLWLSAPSGNWPEASLWDELWQTCSVSVPLPVE